MVNLKAITDVFSFTAVKIVAAITVLLIGLVIGRFLSNLTKKILKELEVNKFLKEEANINLPVEQFLSSLVRYLIYFIAIIISLNQLGLTTTILYILLTIILILLVAFLILAIKDFIPNVVAGLFLHQKEFFKKGDKIKINNIEGKVIKTSLTETQIKTSSNDIMIIPNSVLTKNIIVKKKS